MLKCFIFLANQIYVMQHFVPVSIIHSIYVFLDVFILLDTIVLQNNTVSSLLLVCAYLVTFD